MSSCNYRKMSARPLIISGEMVVVVKVVPEKKLRKSRSRGLLRTVYVILRLVSNKLYRSVLLERFSVLSCRGPWGPLTFPQWAVIEAPWALCCPLAQKIFKNYIHAQQSIANSLGKLCACKSLDREEWRIFSSRGCVSCFTVTEQCLS